MYNSIFYKILINAVMKEYDVDKEQAEKMYYSNDLGVRHVLLVLQDCLMLVENMFCIDNHLEPDFRERFHKIAIEEGKKNIIYLKKKNPYMLSSDNLLDFIVKVHYFRLYHGVVNDSKKVKSVRFRKLFLSEIEWNEVKDCCTIYMKPILDELGYNINLGNLKKSYEKKKKEMDEDIDVKTFLDSEKNAAINKN